MKRRGAKIESKVTTLSAWLVALCGSIIGLVLMYWATRLDDEPWKPLIGEIGSLILATALLALMWDLIGRRAFAEEILAKAKLSSDIVESGITRVTDQYLDDVEWGELFARAKQVDIVVAYANTWRNTHRSRLERIAAQAGTRMRVFLPDPDDSATVINLAERFGKTAEEIRLLIRGAIDEYKSLARPGGGTVEVHVRAGDALFSAYRFDSRAVLTLYSHTRCRTLVPTWVMDGGELFSFVQREVDAIAEQSKLC